MIKCTKCKKERGEDEFDVDLRKVNGKSSCCKPCKRENSKKWHSENSGYVKEKSRNLRSRDRVFNSPKRPEDSERWRENNKRRVAVKSKIAAAIVRGDIYKPKVCPKCDVKTDSRKMFIILDEYMKFRGFQCSFCHHSEAIKKRDEAVGAGI